MLSLYYLRMRLCAVFRTIDRHLSLCTILTVVLHQTPRSATSWLPDAIRWNPTSFRHVRDAEKNILQCEYLPRARCCAALSMPDAHGRPAPVPAADVRSPLRRVLIALAFVGFSSELLCKVLAAEYGVIYSDGLLLNVIM